MLSLEDYTSLGAAEIARLVKAGSLSPVDVVDAALSIQQRLDTSLHAFCTPTPEAAREAARALEARIRRGDEVGALAGVPVAIKDLVSTKGVRTTYGSKLYEDFIPDDDDIVVERLKAADAIILGKTNASEFGYGGFGHNPVFPTTRNPWNLSLTPGGSSAGSAAAVASRICPIAIASDGGGSIRLPAAFCGLVGIKASMGRVPVWPGCRDPRFPGVSGWESIEHIGPLARSVIDAALMLDVIAGPDARDRLSIPDEGVGWIKAASSPPRKLGLKIAYCPDWGGVRVDRRVRALVDRAVARFETDLACIVTIEKAPFGDFIDCFRAIVALETDIVGMRALSAEAGGRSFAFGARPAFKVLGCGILHRRHHRSEKSRSGDGAIHDAFRSDPHADGAGSPLRYRSGGAGHDRIRSGRRRRVDSRALSGEPHRPTRRQRPRRMDRRRPAGWSANHRAALGGSDCGRSGRCLRGLPTVDRKAADRFRIGKVGKEAFRADSRMR